MKITRINGHSIASSEIDENSVVIDLGANIGKFSKEFHARFGSRTIAIEPNPDHRAQLINDAIRVIRDDVITGDGRGVDFSIAENTECASVFSQNLSKVTQVLLRSSITFHELLRHLALQEVDLVKCDIEGAELELLLQTDASVLRRCRQISVEFHETMGIGARSDVQAVMARMEKIGFRTYMGSFYDFSDVLFLGPDLPLPPWWPIEARLWKMANGLGRVFRRRLNLPHH